MHCAFFGLCFQCACYNWLVSSIPSLASHHNCIVICLRGTHSSHFVCPCLCIADWLVILSFLFLSNCWWWHVVVTCHHGPWDVPTAIVVSSLSFVNSLPLGIQYHCITIGSPLSFSSPSFINHHHLIVQLIIWPCPHWLLLSYCVTLWSRGGHCYPCLLTIIWSAYHHHHGIILLGSSCSKFTVLVTVPRQCYWYWIIVFACCYHWNCYLSLHHHHGCIMVISRP